MLTVTRSGEARIVETLNGIQDQCQSWTAVIFHLNGLLAEYRSEYHLKIAVNLIADLLEEYEGGIYLFADGAVAVLCNYLNPMLMGKLLFQMRYLYMDDPLAYHEDGQENAEFCTIYRLKDSFKICLDFCSLRMMQLGRADAAQDGRAKHAKSAHAPAPGMFDPSHLAAIEHDLSSMDISGALRRQPICAVTSTGAIRRVFDELYFHIANLRELIGAEIDFLSNKWLFQYVTSLLDERVLSLLTSNAAQRISQPVSININAETLLTDAFLAFDDALKSEQKVSVVFEIPVVSVFADPYAFVYARDAVQRKGYRVCIDGLTVHTFPSLQRNMMQADLLKLCWNADTPTDLAAPDKRLLTESVRAAGVGRVILCRCDDRAAVDYGQALGISLFQGRYLDGLLAPNAKVVN